MSKVDETLKARIENGQVVVPDDALLPEGAEVELHIVSEDGMSDEERAELNAALDEGLADIEAGRVVPMSEVMAKLKARSA